MIVCGIFICGPISGALLNPAVGFALGVVYDMLRHPMYIILVSTVNLLAGVLAALLFYLVCPTEFTPMTATPLEETRPILQEV